MSDKPSPFTAETRQPTRHGRLARWIEDPFASVIGGIVIPTFAVALLLSSMAGLSRLLPV